MHDHDINQARPSAQFDRDHVDQGIDQLFLEGRWIGQADERRVAGEIVRFQNPLQQGATLQGLFDRPQHFQTAQVFLLHLLDFGHHLFFLLLDFHDDIRRINLRWSQDVNRSQKPGDDDAQDDDPDFLHQRVQQRAHVEGAAAALDVLFGRERIMRGHG